jgi:hypothetical protein
MALHLPGSSGTDVTRRGRSAPNLPDDISIVNIHLSIIDKFATAARAGTKALAGDNIFDMISPCLEDMTQHAG